MLARTLRLTLLRKRECETAMRFDVVGIDPQCRFVMFARFGRIAAAQQHECVVRVTDRVARMLCDRRLVAGQRIFEHARLIQQHSEIVERAEVIRIALQDRNVPVPRGVGAAQSIQNARAFERQLVARVSAQLRFDDAKRLFEFSPRALVRHYGRTRLTTTF